MTLRKKIVRGIPKNLSFYITASLLTALTVMMWVGAFSVSMTIRETYADVFENAVIEDGNFTSSAVISETDIQKLEADFGVILEEQMFRNTEFSDSTLRVFADTKKLNKNVIIAGSGLQTDSDILLTYDFAKAHDIGVGDSVELFGKTFGVTGLCMKPDYSAMYAELTDNFPDSRSFGIAVMTENAAGSIGGFSSFYSVKYLDESRENDFRAFVYGQYGTLQYISRKSNPRISVMTDSGNDLEAEFSVYSPMIMLVAVIVIAMVLSRTVKRESKTIGTLMALGYRKNELIRYYMTYALIPAIAGDTLGLLLSFPFSNLFCVYFFRFAEHIDYTVKMPYAILALALLIPLAAYSLTAFIVLSRTLGSDVVPLLKGTKKSRISHLLTDSNMKLTLLYNIRAVISNTARSLTLLFGIAVAAMAVILAGVYQNAYDDVLDNKVPKAMMGGKYEYGFKDFQSGNPYGDYAIFDVSFGVEGTDSLFNLIGCDDDCEITDMETLSGAAPDYSGYYMTTAAAQIFGVHAGESFTFYNLVSMEKTTVTISDIVKNDILSLVITNKANAAKILGRNVNEFNNIISYTPLDIPDELLIKSASLDDYRTSTANAFRTAQVVLNIVKVIGMMICLLVSGMLAGMLIEENRRSISMLEVLGWHGGEIRRLVLTSNHLIVPVGFLLGVPMGIGLAKAISAANAASNGMIMTAELTPSAFFGSLLIVTASYALSLFIAGRKLKKVDMVECLKENRE